MIFKTLESSKYKDKYFYRTEQWDCFTKDMIHVFDSQNPRIITMDPWPQQIYLDADGQMTIANYIMNVASLYSKNQVPKDLDEMILNEMVNLIEDLKIIKVSDYPVDIEDSVLKPIHVDAKVDMVGIWKGTYTYNLPEEYGDKNTKEVKFTIEINETKGNHFLGIVEDDLESGGTEGIGNVNGKFTNDNITFDKMMPIYTEIDENGDRIIVKNKNHPVIKYEGDFSGSKKYVSGNWFFKKKKIYWKGIIPVRYNLGNGYFNMNKVENDE